MKPTPNPDDLYVVLRSYPVAKAGQPCTYTELAHQYKARKGDWSEPKPHGSWDAPLCALHQRLHVSGGPGAASRGRAEGDPPGPGRGFWGSAPSVPPRPKSEMDRLTVWHAIVQAVFVYTWPAALPQRLRRVSTRRAATRKPPLVRGLAGRASPEPRAAAAASGSHGRPSPLAVQDGHGARRRRSRNRAPREPRRGATDRERPLPEASPP
jgi:hypothetical protein